MGTFKQKIKEAYIAHYSDRVIPPEIKHLV